MLALGFFFFLRRHHTALYLVPASKHPLGVHWSSQGPGLLFVECLALSPTSDKSLDQSLFLVIDNVLGWLKVTITEDQNEVFPEPSLSVTSLDTQPHCGCGDSRAVKIVTLADGVLLDQTWTLFGVPGCLYSTWKRT